MNAGSTSGGCSRHFSLRRRRSRSRSRSSNPLCMATHNRPNGPTPRHREGREPVSGDVIVTVTLNAALHVAYEVLAPGETTPPRPPQLSFPGGPIPPDPPSGGLPGPPYPPRPPRPAPLSPPPLR